MPTPTESQNPIFAFFFQGIGGFQKSYVIFEGGMSKYLLFLTVVGGQSEKGQKHPYVIKKWPLRVKMTLFHLLPMNYLHRFSAYTVLSVSKNRISGGLSVQLLLIKIILTRSKFWNKLKRSNLAWILMPFQFSAVANEKRQGRPGRPGRPL